MTSIAMNENVKKKHSVQLTPCLYYYYSFFVQKTGKKARAHSNRSDKYSKINSKQIKREVGSFLLTYICTQSIANIFSES